MMKNLIRIEEMALFALAWFCFGQTGPEGWFFWALLLVPDIGMAGYVVGPRFGALAYNIFHHRAIAIALMLIGELCDHSWLIASGSILLAHISMDRVFGYGLKYSDSFFKTHLGPVGNRANSVNAGQST